MALASSGGLDLAGCGDLEPLLGRGLRLHLGHFATPFLYPLRASSKKPSRDVRFSGRRNKVRERLLLICGSGDEPFRKHSTLPRHALPVSSDARL
jgi:hypothetical protein